MNQKCTDKMSEFVLKIENAISDICQYVKTVIQISTSWRKEKEKCDIFNHTIMINLSVRQLIVRTPVVPDGRL